jgi:hypothetical protein
VVPAGRAPNASLFDVHQSDVEFQTTDLYPSNVRYGLRMADGLLK